MRIRKFGIALFTCAVMALVVTACNSGNDIPDLHEFIDHLRQEAALRQKSKPLAVLKAPLSVNYMGESARSPFTEAQLAITNTVNTSNPLLGYPLNVLRFVGTLTQGKTTYAFIAVPDNMIYQVKDGDKIGDHLGVVIDIQPDRISVMESDANNGKGPMRRIVTLELRE